MDGRNVYSELFSGTLWGVLDMPLEDIDRNEVIRGPGATMWGANAANGVINIITKSAEDTQGSLASAGPAPPSAASASTATKGSLAPRDTIALAQGFDRSSLSSSSGGHTEGAWGERAAASGRTGISRPRTRSW